MHGFATRRRSSRLTSLLAAGVAGLGGLALGLAPSASGSVPKAAGVAVHSPAGDLGNIFAISTVPHSSDLWALAGEGETSCSQTHYFVLHRHHGRWHKIKAPKVGSCGVLTSILAVSSHEILVAGGRQAEQIQNIPSVYRLAGSHFVRQKTPEYCDGASDVEALAASSTHNVWAAGAMWPCPADDAQAMLRWQGKAWASVGYPTPNNEGISSISTSAPGNAWGLEDDGTLVQWNGKTWAQNASEPAGDQLRAVATSSPKLAYAVGSYQNPSTLKTSPAILRFNGTTWSKAPVAKGVGGVTLYHIAIHGKTAWAIGYRYNATTDTNHPVIMRTTGGGWKVLKNKLPKTYSFNSVSAASASRAFIGGYIENESTRTLKTLVVEVSGTHVKVLPSHS